MMAGLGTGIQRIDTDVIPWWISPSLPSHTFQTSEPSILRAVQPKIHLTSKYWGRLFLDWRIRNSPSSAPLLVIEIEILPHDNPWIICKVFNYSNKDSFVFDSQDLAVRSNFKCWQTTSAKDRNFVKFCFHIYVTLKQSIWKLIFLHAIILDLPFSDLLQKLMGKKLPQLFWYQFNLKYFNDIFAITAFFTLIFCIYGIKETVKKYDNNYNKFYSLIIQKAFLLNL